MKQKRELWELEFRKNEEVLQVKINSQEEILKNVGIELHDNIGQLMGLLKIQVHMLESIMPVAENKAVNEIKETINTAIGAIRQTSKRLVGIEFQEGGLKDAIEKEFEMLSRYSKIESCLHFEGTWIQLPAYIETSIYRIIQEALNNCIKHAHARTFKVTFSFNEKLVRVIISDDGKGFDIHNSANFEGIGLRNLKRRLSEISNDTKIDSVKGIGTNISFSILLNNLMQNDKMN